MRSAVIFVTPMMCAVLECDFAAFGPFALTVDRNVIMVAK